MNIRKDLINQGFRRINMSRKKENTVPTSIRLNTELLDKIKEDAYTQGRSITKQIEQIIIKYYKIEEHYKD